MRSVYILNAKCAICVIEENNVIISNEWQVNSFHLDMNYIECVELYYSIKCFFKINDHGTFVVNDRPVATLRQIRHLPWLEFGKQRKHPNSFNLVYTSTDLHMLPDHPRWFTYLIFGYGTGCMIYLFWGDAGCTLLPLPTSG